MKYHKIWDTFNVKTLYVAEIIEMQLIATLFFYFCFNVFLIECIKWDIVTKYVHLVMLVAMYRERKCTINFKQSL